MWQNANERKKGKTSVGMKIYTYNNRETIYLLDFHSTT